MYSKQGQLIQAFYDALEPRAADAMFALLGQCQHDLEHRGRLSILNTLPEGASGAVLTVANYPIPPDSFETQYPSNGMAADFWGRVRFRGVVQFDQQQIGGGAGGFQPLMGVLWMGAIVDIPAGWALMDGTANSVGNGGSGIDMRGMIPYGYSGAGDFATIGGTIAIALATSFAGSGTATSSSDGTHGHSVSGSEVAGSISISAHSGSGTFNTGVNSATLTLSPTPLLEHFDAGSGINFYYFDSSPTITPDEHQHSVSGSNIAGTLGNHTVSTSGVAADTDSAGAHTHTITIQHVAAGLSIDTPSTVRTPGIVVAFIEKLA